MTDHRFARGDRGIIIQFSNPSRSSSSKRSRSDSDSYSSPHYSSSSSSSSSSSHGYSQPPPYGHYGGYGSYGGYGYGSTPPPPSYLYNSLPADASSTLFVEGLPADVTVREVSHIFRPFPGYQSLRIVPKESKADPAKVFTLCFVEYDSKYVLPSNIPFLSFAFFSCLLSLLICLSFPPFPPLIFLRVQSYAAMQSLQGYRMDDKDNQGLRISYARSNLARRGGGGSGGGGSAGERGEERDRRRDDRDKPMKMDTMPSQ